MATSKAPRSVVSVYLRPHDRVRLEQMAAAGGLTRSAVVRRLLDLAEGVTPSTIHLRKAVR